MSRLKILSSCIKICIVLQPSRNVSSMVDHYENYGEPKTGEYTKVEEYQKRHSI